MKMKHVGLYNDGHFGAQSLHLRCGLVSPSSWHHAVRYLPNMQDSVLERWLAFLQTGFSPVELSELSLAHSSWSPPFELSGWLIANLSASRRSLLDDYQEPFVTEMKKPQRLRVGG